jgi:hypothetical protein
MKVICKRKGQFNFLTINRIYKVEQQISIDDFTGFELLNDHGTLTIYPKNYFYTNVELRNKKIKRILK